MLEQNLDKIDWFQLSKNPAAIHIKKNKKLNSFYFFTI